MNKDRTCSPADAELTQARSPDVPVPKFADHSRAGWGYTYFVRSGDAIKIGHTGMPKQRIGNLQCGFPQPLKVLAVVPNSIIDEFAAHQKFGHLRMRGEWFRAEPELLEFIAAVKAQVNALPRLIIKVFPSPELKAIRKQLARQRPHLPKDAQPHASEFIEMVDNVRSEEDFIRLKPFMAKSQRARVATML